MTYYKMQEQVTWNIQSLSEKQQLDQELHQAQLQGHSIGIAGVTPAYRLYKTKHLPKVVDIDETGSYNINLQGIASFINQTRTKGKPALDAREACRRLDEGYTFGKLTAIPFQSSD